MDDRPQTEGAEVTLPVDDGLPTASPAAFLRPDLQERWKRAMP